jgi:nicotinamide-nucleotide amidase
MEDYFKRRSRTMPSNNVKQAMLPATAEILDNPIGTACGFALDIGKVRFFFTPGVPREMKRMVEEQILPRLLARTGTPPAIVLKRFHSYGLGEAHVDQMLDGIEAMAADGSVKLGFRAHYPQLETKLVARGRDQDDVRRKLEPIEAEVRRRIGNFILCEDDQTLEGVVLAALSGRGGSLAVVETFTSGLIAARIAHLPGAEAVFRRGVVARDPGQLAATLGTGIAELSLAAAEAAAGAARAHASHALAVLVRLDEGADRLEFGGTIYITIAAESGTVTREARLLGGRDWVRLGAVEMALDCLRRHLQGLPVDERIDFEKR